MSQPTVDYTETFLNYPTHHLLQHFHLVKIGKGTGPYADIIDILRALAITDEASIHIVWHYLQLFMYNMIQSTICTTDALV
jgi:hypothetical protein